MRIQQNAAKRRFANKNEISRARVSLRKLPTGVRGLDDILCGGISEYSFNVVAGMPGTGKTTMAHQFMFANATVKTPALYFTALGESALQMLRYQQQYSFFDKAKIGKAIRFVNLSNTVAYGDLGGVLAEIIGQVVAVNPSVVVVDSFRSVMWKAATSLDEMAIMDFIQRLAQSLTGLQTTTLLIGEYDEEERRGNPLFTTADGLYWLSQRIERNSVLRKLQILKVRAQASIPGLHTVRIGDDGLQAFSRTQGFERKDDTPRRRRRLSMGIPELDRMMDGGPREGDSLLIAGPSGTGKSALATQFIAAGLRKGEPGIMAIFEERPRGYAERADSFDLSLKAEQKRGRLEIVYLRPLDLSVDEVMQEILDAVERVGAKRLVIDSLVSLEMALTPGFRADFRESLYRMIVALIGAGVTILSTVEVEDTFTRFSFSHYTSSFLTDDILRLRYVEIDGQLRKIMVVIKMRGGNHSKDIREYIITDKGVVVIRPRSTEYEGLTPGFPVRTGPRAAQKAELPPEPKATV